MPVTFIQSGRFGLGGYSYTNSEAADLVARMSSAPNDTRKGVIDTCIGSLKTAGVWAKLDALYLFAAHDNQAALLNWKGATYDATAVNSPTFTTNRGFTGVSTGYVDSNFNPTTASSPKFVQNSATLGIWSRTSGAIGGLSVGSSTAQITPLYTDTVNNYFACKVNNVSGPEIVTGSDGSALFTATRRGSATGDGEFYRNATTITSTGFGTSATPTNATIRFCGIGAADWLGEALGGFIGEQLSDTEVSDTYNALNTYRTAVGA